jgi:glycosyltransferase involved in cell wall biosynthesis
VITVNCYCAERLEELYGVKDAIVVPELIDLNAWHHLFLRANPATTTPGKFTIMSVCRFYPGKRLDVLLRAAGLLRKTIPGRMVKESSAFLPCRPGAQIHPTTYARTEGTVAPWPLGCSHERCDWHQQLA